MSKIVAGPVIAVKAALERVGRKDTTVLLQGETGTGKEVAARMVHACHETRSSGPFVAVHCGAIPETLLESELFGYVKGAFTGASGDRVGKFELANRGTLFLDEVSTMTPGAQVRLLRVLQEQTVTRVGDTIERKVDVRVIAATNEDLAERVESGEFRQDLYFRLAVFPVQIPPLRDVIGDLVPLIDSLLPRVAQRLYTKPLPVDDDVFRALAVQRWPGNVRELWNALEYALIQAEGSESIRVEHLPPGLRAFDRDAASPVVLPNGIDFKTEVLKLETSLLRQALDRSNGSKSKAAGLLNLPRSTFLDRAKVINGGRHV